MKTKLGLNDLCLCGSGKKVKKCCKLQRSVTRYTQQDRLALLDALDHFIDTNLEEEEEQHYDDFWGVFLEREDELPRELISASSEVQFMSFSCDWEVEPQTTALDLLLAQQPNLSLGARAFARALRSSTLRLYEVTSVVPGMSLTLRDLLEGGEVTIAEKTASRTLNRYDWLAARVVESGCSGQPEIEQGIMAIPSLQRDRLHAQLVQLRASAVAEGELKAFQRDLPALIHEHWVGSVLEPQIPELHNTDGEPLLITHVHFDVLDRAQLERALDAHKSLSREDERWSWSGTNAQGTEVSLGSIELRGDSLVLETNSKARGERGAQLLCALAQGALAPRATTHEDPTREIRERIKSGREDHAAPPSAIPPEIAEAVVLDHYAKHYQQWLDEPVPALDGKTPRAAALQPKMQQRVVELIRGLERMYQQGLREGAPAYDPSWMWAELGLHKQEPWLPPPLPHERLAHFVDGADTLIGEVAETLRKRPGFDDASTVLDHSEQLELLDVQRFLKNHPPRAASTDTPSWQQRELAPDY